MYNCQSMDISKKCRKKKTFQRWYWLEKKRRKRIIKYRNINRRRSVVQSTPPLWWSLTSLTCHLPNRHDYNKICIESQWKWSKSDSATILINNHKQILFHPRISSSTQVILADRPLPLNGKFYWEIFMPAVYGTSIMFGIASKLERIYTNKSNFYFS
jgi:hypothetical protein